MKRNQMGFFGTCCLMVAALPLVLRAGDIFMREKMHSEPQGAMGLVRPAKDEVHTVWIAKDKARNDGTEQSTILRLDKNVIYVLDSKKKTVLEIPLIDEKGSVTHIGENQQKAAPTIRGVERETIRFRVAVAPTREKKKIGDWNCAKYVRSVETGLATAKYQLWATEDLVFDHATVSQYHSAMMAANPQSGLNQHIRELMKEMSKVKGIIVYTAGIGGGDYTELLEIREGTAPSGIFEPPAGYAKATSD